MDEFKLYSVSDEYVGWLRKNDPNVYSNKVDTRKHTRKYLGIVLKLDTYNYYIPLSSPKDSDYEIVEGNKIIKKSIVPISRIVVINALGKPELKGTLRISHMIPVPDTELALYDLDNEADDTYKDLVQNEMIFIRKNKKKIEANAKMLYKQKQGTNTTAGYVKAALDFKALEKLCDKYIKNTHKDAKTIKNREEIVKSLVGVLPKEVDVDMARDERLGEKQMDKAVAINILKNQLEKAEASILKEGTVSADELEQELDVDK